MRFGEKFASIQVFNDEAILAVGEEVILEAALYSFRKAAERHPEVVVVFEQTIRQTVAQNWFDFIRREHGVRTEAMVIRAQLALEAA
ncbi:hypothetical protein SEA_IWOKEUPLIKEDIS_45 [Mycobacterium phage Iwokeuplikedis]|nr:hypothetical protein SEA_IWOKEUPLIKEDIS_45 [Mycobacterium phage Iwokeuplikedis]